MKKLYESLWLVGGISMGYIIALQWMKKSGVTTFDTNILIELWTFGVANTTNNYHTTFAFINYDDNTAIFAENKLYIYDTIITEGIWRNTSISDVVIEVDLLTKTYQTKTVNSHNILQEFLTTNHMINRRYFILNGKTITSISVLDIVNTLLTIGVLSLHNV